MNQIIDIDAFLAGLGPEFEETEGSKWGTANAVCHCGAPVVWGYDGNSNHHRGMCERCDEVRCDAYPGECGR